MPTEEQYKQRIEALEARIAELTLHLERVTRELDEANTKVASCAPERAPSNAAPRLEQPSPGSLCTFCDGEGIYWVHDFEMVCRRCNGTGYVPGEAASPEPAETS